MHKSICDQYGYGPAFASYTTVPAAIAALEHVTLRSSDFNSLNLTLSFLVLVGAGFGGVISSIGTENNFKTRARQERWNKETANKKIQQAQLKTYGKWMAGGVLLSSFLNVALPDMDFIPKSHQQNELSEQSEEITLYQAPQ